MQLFNSSVKSMLIGGLMLVAFECVGKEANDWENPKVFDINKEKPHAYFIPHKTIESAKTHEAIKSEYYQSLNGNWKFKLVNMVEEAGDDFADPKFNDKKWKSSITLPDEKEKRARIAELVKTL